MNTDDSALNGGSPILFVSIRRMVSPRSFRRLTLKSRSYQHSAGERSMSKHDIAARQNKLASIMERIAASYDESTPKIHHLDRMPLPSREDAAAILGALEEVLYPGYFTTGGVTHQGIIYRVQERVGWLFEHLRDQISKGLRHMKELDGELSLAGDEIAEEYTYTFLESIPDVRRMLAKDILAAYDGDPAAHCIDEILLSYPAAYAITAYRAAHELHRIGVP